MPNLVNAPWTEDQVASLNACQQSGVFHPFTCSGGGGPHGDLPGRTSVLIAETGGWRCPVDGCGHRQAWAHSSMADWSWRVTADALRDLFAGQPPEGAE